mgnify:CR=1 FL=1
MRNILTKLANFVKSRQKDIFLGFFRQPVLAFAAAAVLLFVVVTPLLHKPAGFVSVALYNNTSKKVEVGAIALLRVEFRAAENLEDITFRVELPEGARFVSAHDIIAESKALAFHGDVKKNRSIILPVAVRIVEEGPVPIKVEATKMGSRKIVLQGKV